MYIIIRNLFVMCSFYCNYMYNVYNVIMSVYMYGEYCIILFLYTVYVHCILSLKFYHNLMSVTVVPSGNYSRCASAQHTSGQTVQPPSFCQRHNLGTTLLLSHMHCWLVHTHTHTHTHTYTHTCTCTPTITHILSQFNPCIHLQMQTHTHTYIYMYTDTYTCSTHIHVDPYTQLRTHTHIHPF